MKIAQNGYAVLLSLLLAACGGGGGTPAGSSTVNLSGTAAKGLLAGATVQAYEVVNGELRAFGQPSVTDEQGAYSLNLPPTDNPVIVKVTATAQTTMLDETGQLVDGKFPKVPAPVGLELRTMVESLRASASVHANPLTDMAVHSATTITDAQGRPVPPTADAMVQAKALLSQSLNGLDPFGTRPLAGTDASASLDQIKLTQLLAGVVKDSQTRAACAGDSTGLTCNLPKGPQLVLGADNKIAASNTSDITTRLASIESAASSVDNEFMRKNALLTIRTADCSDIEVKLNSLFMHTLNTPDGSRIDVYAFDQDKFSADATAANVRLSDSLAAKVLASATGRVYCKALAQQADCTIPPGYVLIPTLPESITNDRWYTAQVQAVRGTSATTQIVSDEPIKLNTDNLIIGSMITSTGNLTLANTASVPSSGGSISLTSASSSNITISNTDSLSISSPSYPTIGTSNLTLSSLNSTLPVGGYIASASGAGSLTTNGAILTVRQYTQDMVINWNSFNIGANSTVLINQPDSNSIARIRVLGNDPSMIYGNLTANGKVFLINPAGVVFGANSKVSNLAGLETTTLFDAKIPSGRNATLVVGSGSCSRAGSSASTTTGQ